MKLLKEIASKNAAVGREEELCEFLAAELSEYERIEDIHGSLIVHKRGEGEPVMVAVAMDTPAVFVTHIEENGFLRFCAAGIDAKKLSGARVKMANGAAGIIACEKGKESITDMFIDMGGSGRGLSTSDFGTPDIPLAETEGFISGFEAGSRACLRAVLGAALAKTGRDVYFVFAAKSATKRQSPAFLEKLPKISELISIDVSAASDIPGEKNTIVKAGGGVCLRAMDKSIIADREIMNKLDALPVKAQREVSDRTAIAAPLHTAYGGVPAVSAALPARYCGELCEMVCVEDIKELERLITLYLQ